MSSLTSNFEAISSLWEMKEGVNKRGKPVFETWPLENYGQCVELGVQRESSRGVHPLPLRVQGCTPPHLVYTVINKINANYAGSFS